MLVTGGTGSLGSHLVQELLGRDVPVRVLSRRPDPPRPDGVEAEQGDVRTGAGLPRAVQGVDTVVHAATLPFGRHATATEVDGTANMLAAARTVGAHFVYVSIVGVDHHRFPYYRAKWAAEQAVAARGGDDWTIQRATQFHDLIDQMLAAPVTPTTRDFRFQPVDVGEVAKALADLVAGDPIGRADDVGGPEVRSLRDLADARRRLTGSRSRLLPLPAIGFLHDFAVGRHLAPDHRRGSATWEQWLEHEASGPPRT